MKVAILILLFLLAYGLVGNDDFLRLAEQSMSGSLEALR